MTTCLIDKINTLSKQSVSAAAIIDSHGNLAGKVLVRFTHSYIGWNHEVEIIFYQTHHHAMLSSCYDREYTSKPDFLQNYSTNPHHGDLQHLQLL